MNDSLLEALLHTMPRAFARELRFVLRLLPCDADAFYNHAKAAAHRVRDLDLIRIRQDLEVIDSLLGLQRCLLREERAFQNFSCHDRSLIHISEPTRQAEISYAVFCLKK